MKALALGFLMLVGAAAAAHAQGCGYGAPPPPQQSPDVFLHSIYDRYIGEPEKTRPIDYSKESELRAYFTPEVVAIIMKDFAAAAKVDEVPTLDGDPFVGSQEWNIPSFDIASVILDPTHAAATVKFTNYGQPRVSKLKLVLVGGAWRIDDVDYGGDAGTLRGMYNRQS